MSGVDLKELQRLRDAAILHEAEGMAENDMWAKELREEIALMVPAIIAELKKQGADDIIVFVGGVIPRQDYDMLYEAGVKGIYGPGTPIPVSARDVLAQIEKAQG